MSMPNPVLYSCHDRDSHPILPPGGWCVESLALAERPQPENWAAVRGDINWILRLNWAHNGRDGTIPLPPQYDDYAKLCADYVAQSRGADWFIIANEPNHRQEWPNGVKISPEQYADAFNCAYDSIKSVRPDARVLVAAVAPWNNEIGYSWLDYYQRMLDLIDECDGLAVHGYTHGADPSLIFNYDKVNGWYWHFPVIYQTIQAIPSRFAHLPIHVTETDQGDDAWVDSNSGWVQNAYQSINDYNRAPNTQKIFSLAIYRWRGDKYEIHNKPQVQADFQAAVARGFRSPAFHPSPAPQPTPAPPPQPAPAPQPEHEQSPYLVSWDPRLDERGTWLGVVEGPGESAPHVTEGQWFDEDEAQGRVNVFLTVLDENGQLAVGVPVHWYWDDDGPGEQDVRPTERKFDPWLGREYSLDFAMHHTAPTYGFYIEGQPSDRVGGLGLGDLTRPGMKIHTSYAFTIQFLKNKVVEPTPAPQPEQPSRTAYVLPSIGANVRREPVVAEGNIVTSIPHGEPVQVLGVDDSGGSLWAHVRYGDFTGWVLNSLLGAQPEPTPLPGLPGTVPALAHPVADPRWRNVTQPYGRGVNAEHYKQFTVDGVPLEGHNGIDFGTPIDSLIQVVDGGRVSQVFDEGSKGFGRGIVVEHPWGQSLYAHLNHQRVAVGDRVSKGDTIGTSGNTGNSTGPHLHFGMRVNPFNRKDGMGGYADPAPYLINTQSPAAPVLQPTTDLLPLFKAAAKEFDLPWQLLASQAQAESSYGKKLLSDVGAQGVMHIMPDTWAEWALKIGAGNDPYDPKQNIRVGAAYLKWLLSQTGNNPYQALIAYGWGIGNWLSDKPRPQAWVEYANKVMHGHDLLKAVGV